MTGVYVLCIMAMIAGIWICDMALDSIRDGGNTRIGNALLVFGPLVILAAVGTAVALMFHEV